MTKTKNLWLVEKSNVISRSAAVLLGFFIPISVAADNVLLSFVLVFWLAGGNYREKIRAIRESPVALSALALFGVLAVGLFYGQASLHEGLDFIGKYIDLFFVPIFITVFKDERIRRYGLSVFLASLALTLFLSFLVSCGLLHENSVIRGNSGNPYVFKLYITQNFFMIFGAFVFSVLAYSETNKGRRIVLSFLALAMMLNVLLMVPGRTGYLVLAVLLVYISVQKYAFKGVMLGTLVCALLGAAAFYGSHTFHDRITVAAKEFSGWRSGKKADVENSIGQRMEFYANTLEIIQNNPLIGVGTGGFEKAYAAQVKDTGMEATHNPHNEYLLIGTQTGILGLLLMLYLFYRQWQESGRLSFEKKHLARALVLSMMAGCLLNSFMLDHAEGLFFAWMSGLIFSETKECP